MVFVFTAIANASFGEPKLSVITDGVIVDLEFSSDGRYFFLGELDSIVRYDLVTREPDHTLRGFFLCTAVSPDGARLAVADESVRIIDVESSQVLNSYSIPARMRGSGSVGKIDFVGDQKLVVKQYGLRSHVADLDSGRWHVIDAAYLFVTPSGRVAIQKQDDRIELRETVSAKGHVLGGLEFRPGNLILSDSGNRLLLREERVGGEDGIIDVWHVVDTQTMVPLDAPWVVASMGEFSEAAWFGDRPVALYHDIGGLGVTVVDIESQEVLFRNSEFPFVGRLLESGRAMAGDRRYTVPYRGSPLLQRISD